MTLTYLLAVQRKQGLTMAAFKKYWEQIHVPLIREIAGPTFPLRSVRHYVDRDPDGPAGIGAERSTQSPAVVVHGDTSLMNWDAIAELEFRDQKHFEDFMARVGTGEGMERRHEDEQNFIETSTAIRQGDLCITTNSE